MLSSCVTLQNYFYLTVKYRRAKTPGSVFFFTVVTFDRRTIFDNEPAVALLRQAIEVFRARRVSESAK